MVASLAAAAAQEVAAAVSARAKAMVARVRLEKAVAVKVKTATRAPQAEVSGRVKGVSIVERKTTPLRTAKQLPPTSATSVEKPATSNGIVRSATEVLLLVWIGWGCVDIKVQGLFFGRCLLRNENFYVS